ncbi:MAG: flagellar hook-basal body protein [Ruminococcaceae bacterium]|jgi:flagellar basal-body rod protein FlgG|nr:flagellar hook-basal body protein [Oscillospiraceae bacterium]
MNISFYTATTGAIQQQDRLDVHANNIANVNNFGFRAKQPSFSQLMTGPVVGIEGDLARGVGSRMEDAATDFRQSALTGTERKLDYAIEGQGFFGLLDPRTGEISYTRDGSFTLSEFKENGEIEVTEVGEDGILTTRTEQGEVTKWYLSDGLGRFVLGTDGKRIEIDAETAERTDIPELPVGVFDFINKDGMLSLGDNRMIPVEKNGGVGLGSGKAVQGYLEVSNADLGNELAKVIEAQRSFQYMLRMITTSDEIETTVNSLR